MLADRQIHRQTDRQTDGRVDHNTPHPYRGGVAIPCDGCVGLGVLDVGVAGGLAVVCTTKYNCQILFTMAMLAL